MFDYKPDPETITVKSTIYAAITGGLSLAPMIHVDRTFTVADPAEDHTYSSSAGKIGSLKCGASERRARVHRRRSLHGARMDGMDGRISVRLGPAAVRRDGRL